MDNHPIPQDITGFQFKLVGNMTVKQFAYIAGGVGLGWIIFILPLIGFIKIPLSIICIGIGAALAFVPIDGRPMDVILIKFLKAVFSPTQYVYQKQGANLWAENTSKNASTNNLSNDQLKKFLGNNPKNKLDKKESVFFQSLNVQTAGPAATPLPTGLPSHFYANQKPVDTPAAQLAVPIKISADEALSQENLLKTAAVLEKELAKAKAIEVKEQSDKVNPEAYLETHQKVLELQNKLGEMLSQKQELEQKLVDLQKTMQQDQKSVFNPSLAQQIIPKETQFVRSIPQNMTKSAGLPATSEFPNLLTGIIKDPRGNPLPNVLVEVKDDEGNAVRAFKTSALGQFASATPLNNGNYTIDFEDPKAQNRFDKVKFSANGQIILPIEVISIDNREELRRSLFN